MHIHSAVFNSRFWATVSKTVCPMLSIRCLSCPVLSVTFVHCGQTLGRIKMKLGLQVGLSPGHTVLDGHPTPPSPKGHSPHPIFGPYLLQPNGCMDQDATRYGARSRPRRLCVRWGPRSPSPIFGSFLLWPNGWMHQDATWYAYRPQPWGLCVRWRPSRPSQKEAEPPIFGPCLLWPNG